MAAVSFKLGLAGTSRADSSAEPRQGSADTDVGFVLNVSYLRRGKLAVEYKKLRAKGAAKLLHLGEFSLAYDGGRLVGFALLKNSCKLLRSGGLCKL